MASLAARLHEQVKDFEVFEPSVMVLEASASRKTASDGEAGVAFSYAISKHKKAFEELAKYDRG